MWVFVRVAPPLFSSVHRSVAVTTPRLLCITPRLTASSLLVAIKESLCFGTYCIMGNACCGASEERPKPSALASGFSLDSNSIDPTTAAGASSQQTAQHADGPTVTRNAAAPDVEKQQQQHQTSSEEESRLELLVQTAGRAMVAVRSTRGSNPYYDQGFAAALAQHLEQTTQFPVQVPPLPAAAVESTVYSRLAQPVWDDLVLGRQDGLAGCAGENPEKYLDRVAESFLDQVVPKQEQLFTNVKPIVESLL